MHTTRALERRHDTATPISSTPDGGPPTEFRIWKAGSNPTAKGDTFFTERSARLLLAAQAEYGNSYSIDINHLSIKPDAPLENQRAVGFFSLAVRDGELWAVDVEFCADMRPAIVAGAWKYFSPVYDIDVDTCEVLGFFNLALTNTPATFAIEPISRIAASRDSAPVSGVGRMPVSELRILASARGAGEEGRKAARELQRRGESVSGDARIAAMLPRSADTLITHGPSSMSFGAMTREQAREYLAKKR